MRTIQTKNEQETKELAAKIAAFLKPGMTILLEGELGAGKTTFTKGLAEGLNITRIVKSPTYTLIREYKGGRLPLYHMDLYRLDETGAEELGLDDYFTGNGVCVVEWGSMAEEEMPEAYLKVELTPILEDISKRVITLLPTGKLYEKIVEQLVE